MAFRLKASRNMLKAEAFRVGETLFWIDHAGDGGLEIIIQSPFRTERVERPGRMSTQASGQRDAHATRAADSPRGDQNHT